MLRQFQNAYMDGALHRDAMLGFYVLTLSGYRYPRNFKCQKLNTRN